MLAGDFSLVDTARQISPWREGETGTSRTEEEINARQVSVTSSSGQGLQNPQGHWRMKGFGAYWPGVCAMNLSLLASSSAS